MFKNTKLVPYKGGLNNKKTKKLKAAKNKKSLADYNKSFLSKDLVKNIK